MRARSPLLTWAPSLPLLACAFQEPPRVEAQLAEPEALARLVTLLPAGATAASAAAGGRSHACAAGRQPCAYCGSACSPMSALHRLAAGLTTPLRCAGDGEQLQSLLAPMLRLLQRSPRLSVELAQVPEAAACAEGCGRCCCMPPSCAAQGMCVPMLPSCPHLQWLARLL